MSTLQDRLAAARPRPFAHVDGPQSAPRRLFILYAALMEWLRRSRSRAVLARLTDRELRDVGLTRAEAERESGKPFWRA